jgi:glycine/serine hydroxymethyltransferase
LVAEDFVKIAKLIKLATVDFDAKADYVRNEIKAICDKYPMYSK